MGLATPSTVAALLYLSMSSTCHAKDTADATDHLEHAVDLAKSIGLFGIADEGMVERWPDGASDFLWEKSMAQTAWGSFVYITYVVQLSFSRFAKVPVPGNASWTEMEGEKKNNLLRCGFSCSVSNIYWNKDTMCAKPDVQGTLPTENANSGRPR